MIAQVDWTQTHHSHTTVKEIEGFVTEEDQKYPETVHVKELAKEVVVAMIWKDLEKALAVETTRVVEMK